MKSLERPNILFIHAESMDGRLMECMGHPSMRGLTPNLDRLAAGGVLFRQAYSTCPVCNPSRASMWSGKYPNHYDCWNNHEGLREGTPTFRDAFERAGYRFSTFGKLDYQWGMHSIRDRLGSWTRTLGIERPTNKMTLPIIVDDDAHPGDWTKADQVITVMKEAIDTPNPFMMCLSTGLVHPAFVTNRKYYDRVDPKLVEIPPGLRDVSDDDHPVDRYARISKNHARAIPPELAVEIRRVYFAMIAELDDVVGRILEAVEELGLSDSTHVVFSSDHGEMACEHNQILKRTMYEPSIHAPLIVAGPGVRSGAAIDDLVSLIDLYPTFLDMMGLDYGDVAVDDSHPDQLEGESLMPQLTGDAPRARDWAFAEYHGDRCLTGTYMLRRGPWKLLRHVDYEPRLFNVTTDRWEMNDLAAVKPEIVAEMTQILDDNFDREGIERRARAYDKCEFRAWRDEHLRQGDYAEIMARVFSGYSRLGIDDYVAWSDEDERVVEKWLNS